MSWFSLKSPRGRARDASPTKRRDPPQTILASGFLDKKGARALSGWKSRYFTLCQGENAGPSILKYFDSDSPTEPVRAEIPLPLEKGSGCISGSRDGAHPILELKLVQRIYRLRCSSKEQYDEWIQAFRTAIDPPIPSLISPRQNGDGLLATPAAQRANIPSPPDNTPAEPRMKTDSQAKKAPVDNLHHASGFVASELDHTALFATSNAAPSNGDASTSASESAAPQTNSSSRPIISPRPDNLAGPPSSRATADGNGANAAPPVPAKHPLQETQSARPPLRPPTVPSLDFQQLNPLENTMSPRNLTPRSSLQAGEQALVGKTAAAAAAAAASIKAGDRKDRSRSPARTLGKFRSPRGGTSSQTKQVPPPPSARDWASPRLENGALSPRGTARAPPVPILSVDMRDMTEETPPDAQQIWTTDGSVYFRSATKLSPRHYRSFKARKFLQPDLYTMDDDSELWEEEEEGSPDSKRGARQEKERQEEEGSRAPPLVERVPSGVPDLISDDDLMDILIRKQERAAQQEQMQNEIRNGAVAHSNLNLVPLDSMFGGQSENQSTPLKTPAANGNGMWSPRGPGPNLVPGPQARPGTSSRSQTPARGAANASPSKERKGEGETGVLPPWPGAQSGGDYHTPGGWKVNAGSLSHVTPGVVPTLLRP